MLCNILIKIHPYRQKQKIRIRLPHSKDTKMNTKQKPVDADLSRVWFMSTCYLKNFYSLRFCLGLLALAVKANKCHINPISLFLQLILWSNRQFWNLHTFVLNIFLIWYEAEQNTKRMLCIYISWMIWKFIQSNRFIKRF